MTMVNYEERLIKPKKKAKAKAKPKTVTGEGCAKKTKTLSNTSSKDLKSDVVVHGNPDLWVCICKAHCVSEDWMKSTKAMQTPSGCVIQVSTQQGNNVAEALTFVPGVNISKTKTGYILT
jgi:hypothetical protein